MEPASALLWSPSEPELADSTALFMGHQSPLGKLPLNEGETPASADAVPAPNIAAVTPAASTDPATNLPTNMVGSLL